MPGGMVKVEGLDCLLSSIRRRVKHVKEGLSIDFDEQRPKMDKVVSALLGKGADPNRRNNEKKKLTWWQWFLSFFYTMVNEVVARKVAESL